VPFIDSTGAHSFALLAQKMARRHEILYLIGARPEVAQALKQAGVAAPEACFVDSLAELQSTDSAPRITTA
jgi:sulfate permease, SulP family